MNDSLLLTFALEPSIYAVPIQDVQEVVPLPELTPLTDAPPFVAGIFNLRGAVVTAIELRQRMGIGRRRWDRRTAVLITPFREKLFGMIVDHALSLIKLAPTDLAPAPDFSAFLSASQGQYLQGVAKHERQLIPIINPERIFSVLEPHELGDWRKPDDG